MFHGRLMETERSWNFQTEPTFFTTLLASAHLLCLKKPRISTFLKQETRSHTSLSLKILTTTGSSSPPQPERLRALLNISGSLTLTTLLLNGRQMIQKSLFSEAVQVLRATRFY